MTRKADLREELLRFWFEESGPERWFAKSGEFDETIRERFLPDYEAAARGDYDDWQTRGAGCVALCLLLDQFPRNLFRNRCAVVRNRRQGAGHSAARGRHGA